MGINVKKILIAFLIIGGMIGIVSAATESISSTYVSPNIETTVWDLLTSGNGHWYVLRYYPPGSLACADIPADNCESTLDKPIPPPGYEAGTPHFSDGPSNDHYSEKFAVSKKGTWVVTLWHSGKGTGGVEKLIQSYKLNTKVTVPIPEFPTVAMPVGAVLGIMFLMSRRNRKE